MTFRNDEGARGRTRAWAGTAAACAWSAYLVVPVDGWGIVHGRPLGLLSLAALAAVWWVVRAGASPGPVRIAVAALALKIAVGSLLVPHGFGARYYANEHFSGTVERGTEPADNSFTRTDGRLRFGAANGPDLPLDFFNDLRFNHYRPTDPDRATLPFSVIWTGFWRVTTDGRQQLYVHSPRGDVQINIGESFRVRVPPSGTWTGAVDLPAGLHRLTITLSEPQGGDRRFEAGRVVDGREEPFDDEVIFRGRAGAVALAADRLVGICSRALDALLGAWLLVTVAIVLMRALRRLRAAFSAPDALAVAWAIGIADAMVFAAPAVGRLITLSGGNDWLLYESQARDIGLNGLWMAAGETLGHGHPFYGQPLYPYFLAACHWLSGDGLAGVYFAQRLLAAATVIALWRTGAMLFDESAGLATLLTAIVVVYEKLTPWSGVLLTETLFVPLVCCWVYLLVRLACAPAPTGPSGDLRAVRYAVLAGAVGGLATLTRASMLLGWIAIVPALAIASGRSRRRWTLLAIVVAAMIGVTSLATARNWIVAHELVPISSEGSVVLFLGNPPPAMAIPPEHLAQYTRWGLDQYAQPVVEYARQQPRAFIKGLGRKAAFTLGWFDTLVPGAGTSVLYVATWIAAAIGLASWRRFRPRAPIAIVAVPLLLAAAHFAADVAFLPNVYGDRMILLFYVLLVPYVALPVLAAGRAALAAPRSTVRNLVWVAALLACGVEAWRPGWSGVDAALFLPLMMAASLLVGEPWRAGPGLIPFGAVAAALTVAFALAPSADAAMEYRRQLAFLALAPAVAPMAASSETRRVATAWLFGMMAAGALVFTRDRGSDVWRSLWPIVVTPTAARVTATIAVAAALAWIAMRGRRSPLKIAPVALVAAALLTAVAWRGMGGPSGVLDDKLTLYAWARAAGSVHLLSGHWWFGLGLGGPQPLPSPQQTTVATGGLMLWMLVSAGVVGASSYVCLWMRALRITARGTDWTWPVLHGTLLSVFACSQSRNLLAGQGAAPGLLALLGLTFALIESATYGTTAVNTSNRS
jgi:hypothetical protein